MTMTIQTHNTYTSTYACRTHRHNNDDDTVLRKIYLSHFIWEVVCEGVGDRTELQHIDPYSYGHQRFFSVLLGCSTGGLGASLSGCWFSLPHLVSNWSGLQTLNRGSRGLFCWVLAFSTASCHRRVWSPNWSSQTQTQSRVPRGPSAGCWLSLPHLVTKLTDFLSSPSYIIVSPPPSSCGRHKLHSFNPSTVKVIILIFLDQMHLLFT